MISVFNKPNPEKQEGTLSRESLFADKIADLSHWR